MGVKYIKTFNNTLVCDIDAPPINLNPLYCTDYIGQIICQAMHEPLFIKDSKEDLWKLGAASSLSVSDDKMHFIFELDPSKKWSNGQPVTASNFVLTFEKLLNPTTNSPFASWFFCILNAQLYNEGKCSKEHLGIKELSTFRLEIQLEQETPYIKALLGTIQSAPSLSSRQNLNGEVTNGPYYLTSSENEEISLKRNKHYKDNVPTSIESVKFIINKELGKAVEEYIKGNIHITCNTYFPFEKIEEFFGNESFHMKDSAILYALEYNEKSSMNKQLFKKLCEIIDIQKIAINLNNGIIPYTNLIPNSLLKVELSKNKYNLSNETLNSQKILFQQPIKVLYADYYPNAHIIRSLKEAWELMGINVEVQGLQFDKYLQVKESDEFHIYLSLFSPFLSHPMAYYLHYLSYLDDEISWELENKLNNYFSVNDINMYSKYLLDIEKIIKERIPIVPLFTGKSMYLTSPNVVGYDVNTDGSICYKDLRWNIRKDEKDGNL
ncbi:ABC transporter substrate-binding protein [Priestia megaterium]|uniref:ABC transporter substrate-binding protein n=1 Tax=Priestia megaterium TaxID=1404 RepID=UPI001ABF1298|nr:ABC transporter substrate-binding protein [Priestia megaterium]